MNEVARQLGLTVRVAIKGWGNTARLICILIVGGIFLAPLIVHGS